MTALSVAVVQGGPSQEAEVSRASARTIAEALVAAGHQAVRIELDAYLADSLRTGGYDVVFPAAHGAVGEDGSLQGLLEVLGFPYVGSGVLASALAMNKPMAKALFAAAGIPVARGHAFARGTPVARVIEMLGPRIVVKPGDSGSGLAVARFSDATPEGLTAALDAAWAVSDTALVEIFVEGLEVTCGVLGTAALPPTEIESPSDAFYTYQARYAPGRSRHHCPARIDPERLARVRELAVAAHVALGCRDLSRVDFVVPEPANADAIIVLEVNTMPGFTATSLYPEAAGIAGIPLPDLCGELASAAHRRGPTRRHAAVPLPA